MNQAPRWALHALALTLSLAACAKPSPPLQPPRVLALAPPGGEWMGVFLGGVRTGTIFQELRTETRSGSPVAVFRTDTRLQLTEGGQRIDRSISTERVYEARVGGPLIGFKLITRGDGGEEVLTASCTPAGISAVRHRPGRADETIHFPPTRETLEAALLERQVATSGQTARRTIFDLEQTFADDETVVEFAGRETRLIDGEEVPVVLIRTTRATLPTPFPEVRTPDGRLIEGQVGPLVYRGESRDAALRTESLDRDRLQNQLRIVLPAPIPAAALASREPLTMLLGGIPDALLRTDAQQTMIRAEDGRRIRVTIAPRPPERAMTLPITPPETLAPMLKPTLGIESNAPAIRRFARQGIGPVQDAWTATGLLNQQVFRGLSKTLGRSNERATDVLSAGAGDCTEHALLLVALLRSVGIPARRVHGVATIAMPDGVPAFYWHAWAEVWIGGWIAVDPTLGQDLADASHIALGDDGNTHAAALIGQLSIELAPR